MCIPPPAGQSETEGGAQGGVTGGVYSVLVVWKDLSFPPGTRSVCLYSSALIMVLVSTVTPSLLCVCVCVCRRRH